MRGFILSILVGAVIPITGVAEDINATGSVTMTDGTSYNALAFRTGCFTFLKNAELTVRRPETGEPVRMPTTKIRSVSVDGTFDSSRKFSDGSNHDAAGLVGNMFLTGGANLSLGEEPPATSITVGNKCEIKIIDQFTGTEQWIPLNIRREIYDGPYIALIDFEGIGDVKWSESSKRVFPDQYNFDPFTGERLVPIDQGN